MQHFRTLRRLAVLAVIPVGLAGTLLSSPVAAAPVTPNDAPRAVLADGSMRPLTTVKAPTDQIRAMAAGSGGQLLTLKGKANGTAGTDSVNHDITCYLAVGNPYGGGAPDADILVDAIVYCDDWVDSASLQIQLYRSNSLVASNSVVYPYVYGVSGTTGLTTCTAGTYFGAATTVLARYDHYPPVIGATKRSLDVGIGCGTAPPPPPPPAGVTVTNPGTQFNMQYDAVSLQLTASGGTAPYAWSAAGLPSGLTIGASTGRITGNAMGAGTRTVTVTATAASGGSGSTSFTWTVQREACRTC